MKIISCFSYKGGAGRSTLALNVIPYLADALGATAEKPFIVVDMDIDSCGLTFLYDLTKEDIDPEINVQSLFGDEGNIPQSPFAQNSMFKTMKPIGGKYNREDSSILFLPAMPGKALSKNGNYVAKDDKIRVFKRVCKTCCCGILFDSAVGDQTTATWSNRSADYILCCMRPTEQFREGTVRFFERFEPRNKNIIVVPNVVPTEEMTIRGADGVEVRYPQHARDEILEKFAEIARKEHSSEDNGDKDGNNYIMDMVDGEVFGVPKVDRFMWQESILSNLIQLTETEKIALSQYGRIAKIIAED